MTDATNWETEGARARPAAPDDHRPVPAALRATTWIGALLLIVAAFVFSGATLVDLHDDESEVHFLARVGLVVLIGVAIAVVGAVALLLRLVAGTFVRR